MAGLSCDERRWCGWSDLNRHSQREPDFESGASTNSTTPAQGNSLGGKCEDNINIFKIINYFIYLNFVYTLLMTEIRNLSALLEDFINQINDNQISINMILKAFHERGFGILLFIFAVPMALPIPVPPGINILLATPLLILTAQQALGRHIIWMPEKIRKKEISGKKLKSVFDAVIPWIKKIELLIKPRIEFITYGIFSNIIGILGFIMAVSVCIPIPLSNTVPSFGIALMAIGTLTRDGLAVIAGAMVGIIWISGMIYIALFVGKEGYDMFEVWIKSLL